MTVILTCLAVYVYADRVTGARVKTVQLKFGRFDIKVQLKKHMKQKKELILKDNSGQTHLTDPLEKTF